MIEKNMPQNWLVCRDLRQWHDRLTLRHDTESEVWLQIQKAGSGESGIRLQAAVEEAICFGWIDGRMHSLDADSFIIRLTPRKSGSIWSLVNRERAAALIADGRMTEAGMAPIREAQANGRWEAAYTSKEKPEIPEDLFAALQADPLAGSNFENWSNSQKLQAAEWVGQSRQPETRESRINKIIGSARDKKKLF